METWEELLVITITILSIIYAYNFIDKKHLYKLLYKIYNYQLIKN